MGSGVLCCVCCGYGRGRTLGLIPGAAPGGLMIFVFPGTSPRAQRCWLCQDCSHERVALD